MFYASPIHDQHEGPHFHLPDVALHVSAVVLFHYPTGCFGGCSASDPEGWNIQLKSNNKATSR